MSDQSGSGKAGYATPMYCVNSVERSIAFYQHLGFTLIDAMGEPLIGWARMHCEGGAIMLLSNDVSEGAKAISRGSITLTMYAPNLPKLREELIQQGIKTGEIYYPGYMPSGEIRIYDPDGYEIMVCQWGNPEQQAWVLRLKENKLPSISPSISKEEQP